ncbi:MAG: AMP-binding protein [Alphaproteobacteria bacterium]|nr:AMP-binding protein [Alphaproteobacteria bacterium]
MRKEKIGRRILKACARTIVRPLFRVRVRGASHFREAGRRVVLIANHASLLDGVLMGIFLPERITFAINSEWARKWYMPVFGWFADFLPLDPTNPMAIRTLIEAVRENKKIMIFPEGRISVTGGLMKVYEGAGIVAEKAGASLLPIRIDGAQHSKFSYMADKNRTRWFPRITLTLLPPEEIKVPAHLTGKARRRIIARDLWDIMTAMIYRTSDIRQNLFTAISQAAQRVGYGKIIAEDATRRAISYKTFLTKSYVLGLAYRRAIPEDIVGVLLPNALANAVTFAALTGVDKTPAMLNFALGVPQVLSCVASVRIKTIVTARQFIEKARLEKLEYALREAGIKLIYLEEFAKTITIGEKLRGLARYHAHVQPRKKSDAAAAVLFTSGSEGMPKAVFLSHQNIMANRCQVLALLGVHEQDVMFNALPMFHSFGLVVGTILPLTMGVKTFYYPSPLHYRIVPELFYDTNATIMLGTDTFYAGYGRVAHPYDFYNAKYAIVGGEKVKDTTYDLWMKKFGVRLMEGYGATETAPVISVNVPIMSSVGTSGRILPGMEYRLKKAPGIETGAELVVRGDNVMMGYMKPDKPGILQPPPNGWYATGDIVEIDADGFVRILGRAKRFAKIAGEMVSLTAVEQAIEKLYPGFIQGIVTIPDEKRGERMVLITACETANVSEIQKAFQQKGYSDLWAPRRVVYMKKPPVSGTGKFNYLEARALIMDEGKPA